jgi:hypothetical protein
LEHFCWELEITVWQQGHAKASSPLKPEGTIRCRRGANLQATIKSETIATVGKLREMVPMKINASSAKKKLTTAESIARATQKTIPATAITRKQMI